MKLSGLRLFEQCNGLNDLYLYSQEPRNIGRSE